mmetsp:Transcript_129733/g.224232  ORF Transcript_129733/g.224232 Transcript_129733/m.224232 type:complete len:231 (-) Transcript_129733:484-1176(-)
MRSIPVHCSSLVPAAGLAATPKSPRGGISSCPALAESQVRATVQRQHIWVLRWRGLGYLPSEERCSYWALLCTRQPSLVRPGVVCIGLSQMELPGQEEGWRRCRQADGHTLDLLQHRGSMFEDDRLTKGQRAICSPPILPDKRSCDAPDLSVITFLWQHRRHHAALDISHTHTDLGKVPEPVETPIQKMNSPINADANDQRCIRSARVLTALGGIVEGQGQITGPPCHPP